MVAVQQMNGNGAEMSAEAGDCSLPDAYSHHACRTECDAMTEHYYRLRDYALNHAECSAIMHIIDRNRYETTVTLFASELPSSAQQTIRKALTLLERQLREPGASFTSSHQYATGCACIATLEREAFRPVARQPAPADSPRHTVHGHHQHITVHPREVVRPV
jgi:hypothetical protein